LRKSEIEMKEPFKKELSENVMVLYGYKDGHVTVKGRLPIPLRPWYPVNFSASELLAFKASFAGAMSFGAGKSGLMLVDPIMIEVTPDCKVRWGFKDLHLEVGLKKIGIWLWFNFSYEELKLGKQVLEDACAWYALPKETRELQGV
jgi:hypothetical protein